MTDPVGWIEGARGPLFTWLHTPAPDAPRRSRAVVLCEPYGPDRMNLHLTHRTLALWLAEQGFATVRFDPFGTGDSSGSPRDPGFAVDWIRDFDAASLLVRDYAGVDEVIAMGTRFGGTLAAWVTTVRPEVTSMAAWGPYLKGGDFLRAERMLTKVSGANGSGRPAAHAAPGDEAYLGFVYPAEARAAIKAIDLTKLDPPACVRARIIGWDADSDEDQLAAAWLAAGINVSFIGPEGIRADDSIEAQAVPEAMLRDTVDWVVAGEPGGRDAPQGAPVGLASPTPAIHSAAEVFRGAGSVQSTTGLTERVVWFGENEELIGIATLPPGGAQPGKPALVLVNGGNNHRPGINRNYTEWARNAAQAGHVCLRFDIRGLGDSPPKRPEDRNVLYRDETRDDVCAAIDQVSALSGGGGVYLAGLCAGAYQSLHAARVDSRVRGIVLLDLLRWDPDSPERPRTGFWNRRRRSLERVTRPILRRILGEAKSTLASSLLELTGRGTEVLLVSCVEGKGFELVRDALGNDLYALELRDGFQFAVVEDTNHIFTPLWAQAWLWNQIGAFLERGSQR